MHKALLGRSETALPDLKSVCEMDGDGRPARLDGEPMLDGRDEADAGPAKPDGETKLEGPDAPGSREPVLKRELRVEPAPRQPKRNAENAKSWNTDKHGNILNGKALYQRFYRSIRSLLACNKWKGAA